MQDHTAAQRWNSCDLRPGSAFHKIMVLPTFMPEAARPYQLPGMPMGATHLDQTPWMQTGLQSLRNSQGLCTNSNIYFANKSLSGARRSPSPERDRESIGSPPLPTKYSNQLEQTSAPPMRQGSVPPIQDAPTQSELSTPPPQLLQQLLASDPAGKILTLCFQRCD